MASSNVNKAESSRSDADKHTSMALTKGSDDDDDDYFDYKYESDDDDENYDEATYKGPNIRHHYVELRVDEDQMVATIPSPAQTHPPLLPHQAEVPSPAASSTSPRSSSMDNQQYIGNSMSYSMWNSIGNSMDSPMDMLIDQTGGYLPQSQTQVSYPHQAKALFPQQQGHLRNITMGNSMGNSKG